MPAIPTSELTSALRWRYATKKFDPTREIPAETWTALEEALVLAPSSMGIQPWKFFVVRDPELRKKLLPASHGQTQVLDCSHFVVFTYRKDMDDAHLERYMARVGEVRNLEAEKLGGFRQMIFGNVGRIRGAGKLNEHQAKQIYIALGLFVASAALLGVDTCPMEGIVPEQYDEILGLRNQGLSTLVCCAAGYRSPDDKYATTPKVRFKASDVVTYL